MNIRLALALSSLAVTALAGCASHLDGNRAIARLEPTRGNTTSGTVRFLHEGDGVWVHGEVRGLRPNSDNAFNIHEMGDCSSGDGMSAGGYFHPASQAPAGEKTPGELHNLKADKYGVAAFSYFARGISLDGPTTSILDKGLVVHRDRNNGIGTTQPTSTAGPRVACAVITAYK